MDKARETALRVIHAVSEKGGYANILLAEELKRGDLSELDRRFATELVYGVVKAGETLDWIIGRYVDKPVKKMEPWARCILRLGMYQLFYLTKIPRSAAVNESVNLARRYGARLKSSAGFINAVLRRAAREPGTAEFPQGPGKATEYLSLKEMHPRWLVKRWIREMGFEAAQKICRFDNEPAILSVRTNTLKITRDDLISRLIEEGCLAEKSALVPEGIKITAHGAMKDLDSLKEGLWQVQDESSMLVAHVVDPQPGEFVLDVCSAPGGKTTHLAQLMENRGRIMAGDLYPARLEKVAENARRLGINIIETAAGDARCIGERYFRQADRVLVDAPCSGLGVLRRRPDARWRVTAEEMKKLPPLQLEILESASRCVKQGGILVYSTCTMEPAENAGVIEKFLEANKDFSLVETGQYLPEKKRSGGTVQLLPHIDGTDGFFIARMERKAT